jgi:anaerobic selenocysteine-containing dehydrogenase
MTDTGNIAELAGGTPGRSPRRADKKISRRSFLTGLSAMGAIGITPPLLVKAAETKPVLGEVQNAVWIPTTCWIGKQECGIRARTIGGRIVKLDGHPDHPRNQGKLCPKGMGQIMQVYDPYRLKAPLIRTNGKGVSGKWKEASWDEALTLVGQKISQARAKDPRLLVWQKGRSKSQAVYDQAFVKASGATMLGHGAYCSDSGYRASEYTLGPSGVLHADFRNTKYLLSWGWNAANAGGNKLCWVTYNQQFLAARKRGMKVTCLDPMASAMGLHKDEWLPNRPGSDLAFFLAVQNQIVSNGVLDKPYLTNYTNSPFLVTGDGLFLRIGNKEQVWDTVTDSVKPFDTVGVSPALEGEFVVGGAKVKTAFSMYKANIASYTPEWAAEITGLFSESIRKVATDLVQNAMIGSTISVDGIDLPYRPVSIMAGHVTAQELGFQTTRAAIGVFMLLGAIEAVGGVRVDFAWSESANFKALDSIKIGDPPYDLSLKNSMFFPISSANPSITARAMLDPGKYGTNYTPEVLILHMTNPLVSHPGTRDLMAYYQKLKFIAVIDPFLNETADYYADVVLPAATIEKYEGPNNVTDGYDDAVTLRVPPIPPLFQSRGETDIYLDLCDKAGILYGNGGYIDQLNQSLALNNENKMDLKTRPDVRDMYDRWAKSAGIRMGVAYFEQMGVYQKGPVPASKYYGYAVTPAFGGIRHRLYGESLLRYQNEMKRRGVAEIYWRDYVPLPIWRSPTMNSSPEQYDLFLISGKRIELKQSRTSFNPLMKELAPKQNLQINPETAKEKGIADGDQVWVESQNAVTGETQKVKVAAALVQGVRPDTVYMTQGYGLWVHPETAGQGPTPNSLFFTGEGYITNTQDQSFQVKVRVYKE